MDTFLSNLPPITHTKRLKKEIIEQLRKEFAEELSKRRREELSKRRSLELARERWRGWITIGLLVILILVVLFIAGYLVWMSRNFGELTMDEVGSVIPMVGTTLLTPVVGLIGAATGFYFSGQASAQASQDTHAAMELLMQAMKGSAGLSNDDGGPDSQ